MAESETREVTTRIPANLDDIPRGTYGLYFYDQEVISAQNVLCDEDIEFKADRLGLEDVCQDCGQRFKCATSHKTEEIRGKKKNESPEILFGERWTVDQLKALNNEREYGILISNLECNGYPYGVKCTTGNWQWANDTDIVVDSYNELKDMKEAI